MFSEVLVANRGEIAVRAFRGPHELGTRTVAVFPWEDRNSVHRLKADESYQIGEVGHPVRAYLSVTAAVGAVGHRRGDHRGHRATPHRDYGVYGVPVPGLFSFTVDLPVGRH